MDDVKQHNFRPARQRGTALVICMILLLIMTLGATTSMRLSNSQLLVANSFQNEQEAFVAAENSIRVGERDLVNNFGGAPDVNLAADGDGYYMVDTVVFDSRDWDALPHETGGVANAQYVIEYIGPAPPQGGSLALGAGSATGMQFVYRVTGRGSSSKGSARFAQTVFTTSD